MVAKKKPFQVPKIVDVQPAPEPSTTEILTAIAALHGSLNAVGGNVSSVLGVVSGLEPEPPVSKAALAMWVIAIFGFGVLCGAAIASMPS